MGQPIVIKKGNETLTVYGQSQLAVHLANGWQLAETAESNAVAETAESTPPTEPKRKRK